MKDVNKLFSKDVQMTNKHIKNIQYHQSPENATQIAGGDVKWSRKFGKQFWQFFKMLI